MAVALLEKHPDGTVNRIRFGRERAVVKAQRGTHYEVIDEKSGRPPQDLIAIRVQEDLLVQVGNEVRAEVGDFFRETSLGEGIASEYLKFA